MRNPEITVVIPTFNSVKTIDRCLSSIRKQSYSQKQIEIIIVDGGSSDNTKKHVKKYNVRIIDVDPKKQNVELNKSIGIKNAKGDLLFMLDHDNILPNKHVLQKMVKPFRDHKDMVGVETLRYRFDHRNTLLDRYFALFGVTDPLAFYLGKADRMSYLYDAYDNKYNPRDYGEYFLVHFVPGKIPTIGANGFLINRKILIKNADMREGHFFPIDVNVDLINKGFDTYAFTKDSITHIAGHGNILYYFKRRAMFVKQYYFNDINSSMRRMRRYSVYEKGDFLHLLFFIIISITFIIPLIDSFRGYLKVRDLAWFIHPIMCFGFVILYGYVIIDHQVSRYSKKF